MWIGLSLLSFLLFYSLFIAYYLKHVSRPAFDRPLAFARGWFHAVIWFLGLLLLGFSAIFCYLVIPWLVAVPLVLAFVAVGRQSAKRESELDHVIKESIATYYELSRRGVPEPEIYKGVFDSIVGTEGQDYRELFEGRDKSWDLESAIQYVILPAKGLYRYQAGGGLRGVEANAVLRDRIKGFISSFEHGAHKENSAKQ